MTIRLRLTIFNAVVLVLTAVGALALGATVLAIYLFEDPFPLVSGPAHEVAYRLANGEALTTQDLNDLAEDRLEITLLNPMGITTVRSSQVDTVISSDEQPIWQEAHSSDGTITRMVYAENEVESFVIAIPVRNDDATVGYVDVRSSYEAYTTALVNDYIFVPIIAAGFLGVVLLLVLVSYILTWRALRPVNRIAAEASTISETDLSRRLSVQGGRRDEFVRLANSINGLLNRIQRAAIEREGVLAAQRRFVADAGHELRTPLTSIRGYARMLNEWGLKDEQVAREGIEVIERESIRLHDLAEGLLTVARGDEQLFPDFESTDLRIPAQEAVEAMKTVSPATAFEVVLPSTPVPAWIDSRRVRQLLTILLDNAAKYSPAGGTVTTTVAVSAGVPTVVVRDNGIGIAEADLPKIFERFYRIDESRGNRGAGLGLAIARQIVDAHDARITVQSQIGHGTAFTIDFKPPRVEQMPSGPSRTRRGVGSLLGRLHPTRQAKS